MSTLHLTAAFPHRSSSKTPILMILLGMWVLSVFGCAQTANLPRPQGMQGDGPEKADQLLRQGNAFFQNGAFSKAIADWEEACRLYAGENLERQQADCLVKLSQAYLFIGQLSEASERSSLALKLAQPLDDTSLLADIHGSLGNLQLSSGDSGKAYHHLEKSLAFAQKSGDPERIGNSLNNIGNLQATQRRYEEALDAYEESISRFKEVGNDTMVVTVRLNAAMAHTRNNAYEESAGILDDIEEAIRGLDPSFLKAYAWINLGLEYRKVSKHFHLLALQALQNAWTVSEEIQDLKTASYALGYMGSLHEEEKQYAEALNFTQRALFAAQQVQAPESLYRWQWQSGRILRQLGNTDEAIRAYRNALNTLQSVREEFAGCYGNPQNAYRPVAGSICFEMVELLLEKASETNAQVQRTAYLAEARQTLELLKAYEIRDYYQDDCVDAFRYATVELDDLSRNAVVIYPILLRDRIEILATLPTGLRRFSVQVDRDTVRNEVTQLRKKLEKRTTWEFLPHAQTIYQWLIDPLLQDLGSEKIDTLVFVPDGPLRNIPMACLHDGAQFLVEKYAVAITPGLNLTDPHPLDREDLSVLAFGLTEPVQGFGALPHVNEELSAIERALQCTSFLNRAFSLGGMEKTLQKEPYNVVHIASHGRFGGEVKDTFLLAFDDKLTLNRLRDWIGAFKFRDKPLELLTLSACETAAGDDRAALGLAGVAIQAGARSALATLWHVNDPAASRLVSIFYEELKNPGSSKAAALQKAQMALMNDPRYRHPGYWSPFLMINNWL